MINFYPLDQQTLFTNREYELAQLAHYRQALGAGPVEHVALFGLRRIGKTLLLKEFMRRTLAESPDVAPVYMDFATLASSPENFAVGYIGQLCYWLLMRGEGDAGPFLSAGSLPGALFQNMGLIFIRWLNRCFMSWKKPAQTARRCCARHFIFPRKPPGFENVRLVLILDEFQEIRTLTHYPNSQNVLALCAPKCSPKAGYYISWLVRPSAC